jgi:hypothetical protein
MNRPRLYRGLRNTASAVCGVVCLVGEGVSIK